MLSCIVYKFSRDSNFIHWLVELFPSRAALKSNRCYLLIYFSSFLLKATLLRYNLLWDKRFNFFAHETRTWNIKTYPTDVCIIKWRLQSPSGRYSYSLHLLSETALSVVHGYIWLYFPKPRNFCSDFDSISWVTIDHQPLPAVHLRFQ